MVDEEHHAADTVKLVIGDFSADWRPETRSLVEDALAQRPDAATLLGEFGRQPWGTVRDELVARLTASYLESAEVRERFEAEAATTRLLGETMELAHASELALRIPSGEIQRAVRDVVMRVTAAYPRVRRMFAAYEANADIGLVQAELHRALAAVLYADPVARRLQGEAVALAAGRSIVHRWQGGAGPEWLPDYVRFVLRAHPAALLAFERFVDDPGSSTAARDFVDDPGSSTAARDFVDAVTPLVAADAALLRQLLQPEVGGMGGPGPSVDLGVLEPEAPTSAEPDDGTATDGIVTRGIPRPPLVPAAPAAPPAPSAPPSPDAPSDPAPSRYRAHPVLRPEGLAPGAPFTVAGGDRFRLEVGIGPSPDRELIAPRRGIGEIASGVRVTIQLVFDPASFRIDGPRPIELDVTAELRFPTAVVDVEVLSLDDPDVANRRIAAHYWVDGELRAVVFRIFSETGVNASFAPPTPSMIDLSPLLEADPPEVVLAIYGADSTVPGTYMMAAFPRSADIPPPEVVRVELDASADGIMTRMYELAGADGGSRSKVLTDLIGKGAAIADAFPDAVVRTLRAVAAAAGAAAPRMLLLSEETRLPWELAAFGPDRPLGSTHGGASPYLGAHFAIGRWPLSAARREQPVPRRDPVRVRKAAFVTARYDGGEGWEPLEGALAEVEELAQEYGPAEVWPPLLDDVLAKLSEDVDVIHFALHGQFLAGDLEDGLVLLAPSADGLAPAYLGADTLSGRAALPPPLFPTSPFVFLNACQVGQGHRVLGDYAGLAVALLRAGASGVVACIWNVDDGIAGSISRDFYRRADDGDAPAEILRSVRARWDPSGDPSTAAPTLLAYQYFGHPSMQVQRTR